MSLDYIHQYQVKAEPPDQSVQPGQTNAAPWIYPWSEPVRYRIVPALAIALAASGLFSPIISPTQPEGIFFHQWFAEPVRTLPGLGPHLQQVDSLPTPVLPLASTLNSWFHPLSDPVWLPIGLKDWLQQTTAWPPRLLPPADVTATMAATETNNDVALIGVQVYDSAAPSGAAASANVSIAEVPTENNAAASLRES